MPIYEYVCQSCQHRFEARQKFSDPPLSTCLRCGQPVTKVISAPAIMFKGSGWYITDYSDKLKAPQGETPASANGKKEGSSADSPASTGTATPGGTSAQAPSTASAGSPPNSGGTSQTNSSSSSA